MKNHMLAAGFIIAGISGIFFSLATLAASTEKIKQKASETADATAEYTHQTKEEFRRTVEQQLADLKIQISRLQEQASKATGDARDKINAQLKLLEAKRKETNENLDSASKKTGKAWDQVKEGMVKAMHDLQQGIQKAKKSMQDSK